MRIQQVQSDALDMVTAVLDEFGRRFGATGIHLWEALVTYTAAEALAIAVIWGLSCIAAATIHMTLLRGLVTLPPMGTGDPHRDFQLTIGTALSGVILFLLMVFGFEAAGRTFATIASPEGAIIMEILR